MTRRPWKLLSLGVLAALVGGPGLAAAQPVKVGAVVPLTGRYGAGGAQVRAGYEIAVEHINAAGGVTVGGKKMPLEVTVLDDESDATKTVSRMETLAAQGVVAYLGGFGSDLHAAAASVADLVLGLPTPPDGMTIVKQMKELGLNPKMTLLIRAPDPPIWSKNLGKDGDYVVLAPGWHHGVKAPGVKELNEAHTKKIGRPADPITGPAYANVQILAAAISHAGSLDKDKIRDAITATDMTTVIGPVKFRPDGTGIVNAVFVQWLNGDGVDD